MLHSLPVSISCYTILCIQCTYIYLFLLRSCAFAFILFDSMRFLNISLNFICFSSFFQLISHITICLCNLCTLLTFTINNTLSRLIIDFFYFLLVFLMNLLLLSFAFNLVCLINLLVYLMIFGILILVLSN